MIDELSVGLLLLSDNKISLESVLVVDLRVVSHDAAQSTKQSLILYPSRPKIYDKVKYWS